MRTFLRLPLLAATLLGGAATGHAQSATLETAPLSILWNFTDTGIVSSFIALPPYIEGTPGAVDPDTLRPTDRITTDIGLPITAPTTGDQAFFTEQLLRGILERYAERYKALAAAQPPELAEDGVTEIDPTPTADMQDLEARIKLLKNEVPSVSNSRWELTAVREPQNTVEGATTTPYAVFVTRIDRTRIPLPPATYDTGLRLVPLASVGSSTETFTESGTPKVGGSYNNHFRLEYITPYGPDRLPYFLSFYATDPLHRLDAASRKTAVDGVDYNTTGSLWTAFGSGYMTFSLRNTVGGHAIAPTKIKTTGHGSWSHLAITADDAIPFGGIAPLSIKMGEIKYQNKHMFADFGVDIPE